jgi:nucleotidyltransferase/DNA polymerase involved in DNA repair
MLLLAVDLNAFYAQCAVKANNALAGQPIGVLQRRFVTTTSHEARRLGAPKCGGVSQVKAACPSIVLVQQNMQLYRLESVAIHQLLLEFFAKLGKAVGASVPPIEKTGIDEFLVDVTSLVFTPQLDAHCDAALAPRDCWLLAHDAPDFVRSDGVTRVKVRCADDAAYLAAARIAADLAALLLERLRFTVSIGIGANRSAAKAAASAHKPAAITVCFVDRTVDLMAPVPLRAIVGVGSKLRARLAQLNCDTCAELRAVSLDSLTATLADAAVAAHLFAVVRGTEPSPPLADSELEPTTVSAESFAKDIDNSRAFYVFLAALAEQLASRLIADRDTFRRVATSFALRVRYTQTPDQSFRDAKSLSRATASSSYATATQAQLAQQLFRHAVAVLRSGGAPPVSEFVAANCHSVQLVIRGIGLAASAFVSLQRRGIDAFFGATADDGGGGGGDDNDHNGSGNDDDGDDTPDAIELEAKLRDVFASPADFALADVHSFGAWRWNEAELAPEATADDSGTPKAKRAATRAVVAQCRECAARFDSDAELAVHADWHVAMSVREAEMVVVRRGGETSATATAPTAKSGSIASFFSKKVK